MGRPRTAHDGAGEDGRRADTGGARAAARAGLLLGCALALGCNGDLFASVVVDGDVGSAAADTGGETVSAPPQPCQTHTECPTGRICSGATGECILPEGALCALPPDDDGSLGFLGACVPAPLCGDACDPKFLCGANLVCVLEAWTLPEGATEYVPVLPAGPPPWPTDGTAAAGFPGRCLQACDPCAEAPGCGDPSECFALADQGGYCHPPPLPGRGAGCAEFGVCAGALACPAMAVDGARRCQVLCRPDFPISAAMGDRQASTSSDCATGELCVTGTPLRAPSFECIPGELAALGTPLGAATTAKYCPVAAQMLSSGLLCSPDCDVEPCPDDLTCFAIAVAATIPARHVCIQDGALGLGLHCAEDRNCRPPLRCRVLSEGGAAACRP